MKRSEYLSAPPVPQFVAWLRNLVGGQHGSLTHDYHVDNCRSWSCSSLWEAHQRYTWNGTAFEQNQMILDTLRLELRNAVDNNDGAGFIRTACRVLEWGGVTNKNVQTLCCLGDKALLCFVDAARKIDPATADTQQIKSVRFMNSGWTKVYSLLLDGFPIYDGRVGAAMGYLVRLYSQCSGATEVAPLLHFRWSHGKGQQHRDPSSTKFKFETLQYCPQGRHEWVKCNLRLAWILGEVCNEGYFTKYLPPERRMRALESALFMIGYDLPRAGGGSLDSV